MAQKYLDMNGLTRYHEGLIDYMSEAVGTQGDMSVTDPTNMAYIKNVPDWVRSETKPEYDAEEVGADATGTAHTEMTNHDVSETAHEDIRNLIQEINTQIEESTWDDKYTKEEVDEKDAATLASAKEYTDATASSTLSDAKSYAEGQATNALTEAKSYADTASASALEDAKEYNDSAYANANAYTDQKIADLINGAPTTLDTLGEIATAMANNEDVVEALEKAIGEKAGQAELDTHTGNTTIHITSTERTNWNDANSKKHTHSNKTVLDNTTASFTTEEKTKLSGIAAGANAYTHPSTHAASMITGLATVATSGKYSDLSGVPSSLPASDVYAWAKASSKPSYTKAEVGLGNVDNTADSAKSVKYATSAGSASSATTAGTCTGNAATATYATTAHAMRTYADNGSSHGATSWLLNCKYNHKSDGRFWMYVGDGTVHAVGCDYATSAGSANAVAWGNVSGKPGSFTPSAHNQAASTITAGTFSATGVVAATGTDYTTNRIRNQVFTTTDPGAGASTSYANGSIICVYE